jgi:hypothetical protein
MATIWSPADPSSHGPCSESGIEGVGKGVLSGVTVRVGIDPSIRVDVIVGHPSGVRVRTCVATDGVEVQGVGNESLDIGVRVAICVSFNPQPTESKVKRRNARTRFLIATNKSTFGETSERFLVFGIFINDPTIMLNCTQSATCYIKMTDHTCGNPQVGGGYPLAVGVG